MALYIGTNYHPHDWEEERWEKDIALMKEAEFTTVRLGHLCWDSYEPEEGVYTFEWFDKVMNLFAEAGIGVVLDVSMRPAPRWVHKLCPGCEIYSEAGTKQESLTRYMEDVDDPAYQKYALRFAEKITQRYKNHSALFAFGLCNELGAGFASYSPYAKQRFHYWLKKKYHTIEELNKAWATQRWSRRYNSFDEVVLQKNEISIGAPEAWLDMRRFYSDGIGKFLIALKETIAKHAPQIPHSSNHYAEKDNLGFDYLKYSDGFVNYPGMGLYPGYEAGTSYKLKYLMHIYMQRLAETGRPMWCLEFQTGSQGVCHGPYGANRMHIFLALIYRAEMVLGWTWRSMFGREEQYHYGMLGHDGVPGKNYEEYKQTANDVKKLEKYAFPYVPNPEIAVAYNYENGLVTQYRTEQYQMPYHHHIMNTLEYFDEKNIDYNVVDLRNIKNKYKLLIIPGYVLMTQKSAETIRDYVEMGGTVIMTGYSATVDENGKVFTQPRPGYLADVFGIRVAGFTRTEGDGVTQDKNITICMNDKKIHAEVGYYEELELNTAKSFAEFEENNLCAISCNCYGKGKAYYVAPETNKEVLQLLINTIADDIGMTPGIITSEGIHVRKLAKNQYFYVNTLNEPVIVNLCENGYGVLTEREYKVQMKLPPFGAELIVKKGDKH